MLFVLPFFVHPRDERPPPPPSLSLSYVLSSIKVHIRFCCTSVQFSWAEAKLMCLLVYLPLCKTGVPPQGRFLERFCSSVLNILRISCVRPAMHSPLPIRASPQLSTSSSFLLLLLPAPLPHQRTCIGHHRHRITSLRGHVTPTAGKFKR